MQNGIPVNYLTNTAHFWSMPFFVNEHTLIPRADTELLVEKTLELIQQKTPPISILELGTGTGCIAISLNKSLTKLNITHTITAVDKYQDTLKVAKKNSNALAANVELLQSDWYTAITKKFDVIVSNPPYIAEDDNHLIELTAEPITALTASDNGLADIDHIINYGRNYLNHNGIIILEHGYNQKQAVQQLFKSYNFNNIHTITDYGGNDRVSFGFFNPSP